VNLTIFIDRETGTWGIAGDLVIAEVPESQVNAMETMSDSELIELAYSIEHTGNYRRVK
jgi:hypothetical protein